eukprot:scaffold181417_cov36-Cyclotella_meneghiniana.AAC.2
MNEFLVDNQLVLLSPRAGGAALVAARSNSGRSIKSDVFFGDDGDHVSALNGPPDDDEVSLADKLSSTDKLSLSRAAWNVFWPSLTTIELLPIHEGESWYKHVLGLQGTASSLVESVGDVLDLLPETLSALNSKMEDSFLSKDNWDKDAERLDSAVSAVEQLVVGRASETARNAFTLRFGSVLNAINSIKESLGDLQIDVGHLSRSNSQPEDLESRLRGLAVKVAATVRASSDHALAHRIQLEERLDALESSVPTPPAAEDALGDIFADTYVVYVIASDVPPGTLSTIGLARDSHGQSKSHQDSSH